MTGTKVELVSDLSVHLVAQMGNDDSVVHAARVSVVGSKAEVEEGERKGLLNFLISNKHNSPVEHVTATMLIECPVFVAREFHRHRVFSYNEWSSRYSVLRPRFYCPDFDRPCKQEGKVGAYRFEVIPDDDMVTLWKEMRHSFQTAWNCYEYLLDMGVAKEVARNCLPLSVYTSFYVTGNLRNYLNFLSLRTHETALHEIREIAFKMEEHLTKIAPICLELWDRSGRGAL